MRPEAIAFFSVRATWSCPMTSSNVVERYLRARTRYDIALYRTTAAARVGAELATHSTSAPSVTGAANPSNPVGLCADSEWSPPHSSAGEAGHFEECLWIAR